MSWGLRVLPSADEDVDESASFIADDSIDQAIRFYDAVTRTYKLILKAPLRWPLYGLKSPKLTGIRKRAVVDFPNFLVFYRVESELVVILRVLHGARDLPGIFGEIEFE